GERDQGIADVSEYLKKFPDHVEALKERAMAYAELEDNAEALQDLERLLKLTPKDAKMTMARSEIHGRLGNLEQAIKDRKAAITIDTSLGGRADPVVADLRTLLRQKTMFSSEREAAEKAADARRSYRVGNKDHVQQLASKALELDPDN